MTVYYCRLISLEYTHTAETTCKAFVQTVLGEADYHPFVPYWKNPDQGELSFSFSSDRSLSEIQQLFADRWQEDTADARWSSIFCPSTTFIWLSQ